jgi:hypothetical protein
VSITSTMSLESATQQPMDSSHPEGDALMANIDALSSLQRVAPLLQHETQIISRPVIRRHVARMTIILKQVENRHVIPNLFSKYDSVGIFVFLNILFLFTLKQQGVESNCTKRD